MNWFTGIVLYVLIWWIALFAVLPFGTQPVAEPDATTGWRGAPARPRIWFKLLVTTVVAAALWGICFTLIVTDWISFRSGWLAITPQ